MTGDGPKGLDAGDSGDTEPAVPVTAAEPAARTAGEAAVRTAFVATAAGAESTSRRATKARYR